MLLHMNPTRQRGKRTGFLARASGWYMTFFAAGVILLFGEDDPAVPLLEHRLDLWVNKTWHVWHCRLGAEMVFGTRYYAYQIDGPRSSGPLDWHAFDPQKVLLDPYAKAVFFPPWFK